jgi:hypothetical protein
MRLTASNAAAGLRHGLSAACKSRQLIFKLGQLHLQLALARASVAGKDVENELGAVDDGARQSRFDVAGLGRGQIVIEEDQTRAGGRDGRDDLLELSSAYQGGRIGPAATLDQDCCDGCAGRPG